MNKIIFLLFLFVILAFGFTSPHQASAADFPSGCGSALGYSTTNGSPCNGTVNSPILGNLSGCTSALGYSVTNGLPCSGGEVALQFLEGCTNTIGYSTISGAPCNGTSIATPVIDTSPQTPGLPLTGAGGDGWLNTLILFGSGLSMVFGLTLLSRKSSIVK